MARRKGARVDAAALFAAARARLAGEPADAVVHRTGLSKTAISEAVTLLQHAPTAERQVLAGEVVFSRAVSELRARRAAERRRAGKRVGPR